MTFQEFQDQRGRNTSNEEDYKEYMAFLEQSGLLNKAVGKKQLSKAAAPAKAPSRAPTQISGGGTSDLVGQSMQLADATKGFTDSAIAKKYNLNAPGGPDFQSVADFKEFGKQFEAPVTPDVPAGSEGGMFSDSTFTGDAKGVATAGMMAMQTAQSQTAQQAIMGGAMTGLSIGSMIGGAAAGPVGVAAGLGTALIGLSNASSQRRKREKAQEQAKKEQERLLKRQEKLRALESYNSRRQRAYESLMGAFR